MKSEKARAGGKNVTAAVMFNEMKICRHIDWVGKRTVGYVDIGNGMTDDSNQPA